MSLHELSAGELVDRLTAGEVTSLQATEAFCDRLEAVESRVKAFLSYDRSRALEQAAAIDRKRSERKSVGKLAGLPIAVKDVLCAQGERTTCGSRILENFRPPYDAHVITRLREEDAVLIGRVNMDEFAMGSSTENSAFQKTGNPWNLACVPGGSSGGSAACVAAGQSPLSIGTDTGGSIRQPASYCGVVGLKPTYGRVSRFGLVAFASSLDQIGPIGTSADDVALLLDVIAGHDPRDSTSVNRPVPGYRSEARKLPEGLRIGIAKEYFEAGLDAQVERCVREAIGVLKSHGANLVDLTLPHSKYAIATYYLVATAEASSNLARYDGIHYGYRSPHFDGMIDLYSATRGEGFGAEVKRRIMLGTFALSAGYRDAYYLKALQVRRLIRDDFDKAFAQCDVLVGPVAPTPAYKIGEKVSDPLAMYLGDIYTVSTNLAGLPGISIPCGFSTEGLPIGLQLQGPPFSEEKLLSVASLYQKSTDWHTKRASP